MIDLNITWFVLVGVLIIGYAILDGFDLGVGIIHLFTKKEKEKRVNFNAIGPVWDGNEVWLLTGGGALFAAFPIVYATIFSGFYVAFILLLLALILRAVSFEFRKYVVSQRFKYLWDLAFGLGSLIPAVLYGVAIGNVMRGLPIELVNGKVSSSITFLGLLNPYSLLIGILSLVLFIMHGAIYLTLKSEGEQQEKMVSWANKTWIVLVVLYIIATLSTFFAAPYLFSGILNNVLFWILFITMFVSLINIPILVRTKKFRMAFLSSSLLIAMMILLFALSLFPLLVPSSIDIANSLTIYNASSTPRTLHTMLIIAIIGMPLVIIYTIFIYRTFKGRVIIDQDSY
jgi:cytochrome d ubiquinol oxidase subunit II